MSFIFRHKNLDFSAFFSFSSLILLSLSLLLKFDDTFGRLIQLLIEQYIEISTWFVKEILYKATVKEVAMDIQVFMSVNHVLVFQRI